MAENLLKEIISNLNKNIYNRAYLTSEERVLILGDGKCVMRDMAFGHVNYFKEGTEAISAAENDKRFCYCLEYDYMKM